MFKRFLTLFLLCGLIVVGLVSCTASDDSGLTVLTNVKGIPDKAEDALDKSENGGVDGDKENENENDQNDGDNESGNGSDVTSDGDIILNTSSKKIHLSSECGYVSSIKESNKLVKPRSEMDSYLENGYSVCSNCNKKYGSYD